MISPKAFMKLPAQRLVESAKKPDVANTYLPQLGIWGLCLPAEEKNLGFMELRVEMRRS